MLVPLPPEFATTRDALHALAEHVLCAARHRVTGRIGLRATLGGFGTPPFGDGERVRVEGIELVHEIAGETRRAPVTTLGAAAAFVGIPLGAPAGVFVPTTQADPDVLLAVDAGSATALASWYAFADARFADLRARHADQAPSETQLWPEHFDLATDLGDADAHTRANYGASPGDGGIAQPYLYAGPWDTTRRSGRFAEYSFGAAFTYAELRAASDPADAGARFLAECATALLSAPE